MIKGFQEFEFDLPDALLVKLIEAFDEMEGEALLPEHVAQLPEAQGVYQLLYEGEIVYVGKTDAEAGLRQRLGRHAWTVRHRCNLDVASVRFKALRVFVFTAIDLETQLIRHYGGEAKVSWNNSGFGSNDPGRERDTTKLKIGGFDDKFPIDLDREIVPLAEDAQLTVAGALQVLRREVPYIVRAESKSRRPHPDLSMTVNIKAGATTARKFIAELVEGLPSGWQATLLPGRIILYRENREYPAGTVIARTVAEGH